ncbi:HpcH/HpaI aldolase family protein [Labrys miyagiensis]|uniref:HpcH/HpaI aldolase family protein n=1 Tax=Labrys miyagiensis TaxID=346912 RepID=UPI0024E04521|nr:aldolase/citrate lyase family protein [Labrys miyagiensis]
MSEAEGLQSTGAATSGGWGALGRVKAMKGKLRDGKPVFGAWLSLNDPAAAEILARTGFDFLLIDMEHGPWDLVTLQHTLMGFNGTDTVPVVRVPWNDHVRIKQVLDMGVEGIMAPMVRTVEECRDLVRACRYPPVGARGFGPRRASNYYRNIEDYVAAANEALFVMPQIEDIATLDVLDEFLAVPGIDAVAIGPNDLSGTTGLFRQHQHPTNKGALDTIIAKAKKAGVPVSLGINTKPADQRALIERGVLILTTTSDLELLAAGSRQSLEANRQAIA